MAMQSVPPEGPPLSPAKIFAPFSADDRWSLERFVRKVDEINASAFGKAETSLLGTMIPGLSYQGGPAWTIDVEGASEEAVKAIVGDFRQLYTDSNNASAMKVVKILQESARRRGTDAGKEMASRLRAFRKELKKRRKSGPNGKFLEQDEEGVLCERAPEEIIDIWLNGEYLHDDRDLAGELTPSDHASVEMMRFGLQSAVRDFLRHWTALRSLVGGVLEDPDL